MGPSRPPPPSPYPPSWLAAGHPLTYLNRQPKRHFNSYGIILSTIHTRGTGTCTLLLHINYFSVIVCSLLHHRLTGRWKNLHVVPSRDSNPGPALQQAWPALPGVNTCVKDFASYRWGWMKRTGAQGSAGGTPWTGCSHSSATTTIWTTPGRSGILV